MSARSGSTLRRVAAVRPSPLASAWLALCGVAVASSGLAQPPEEAAADLAESIGRVSFFVTPVDATIRVGSFEFENSGPAPAPAFFLPGPTASGVPAVGPIPLAEHDPVSPSAPAPLPAGDYLAEVSRPGYRTAFAAFTVTAGEDAEVEARLRRESAALRLRTAPAGAVVLVDGYEMGRTTAVAEAGFVPARTADRTERETFSRDLWIDELPEGPWRVEVRKEGYRTWSADVRAPPLGDETLPPIVLEPERGVVGLKGLPEDAEVLADGGALQPDRERWTPEVLLPPGVHTITVSRGLHGYFETSVTVEDGRRTDVEVELRPALAFLGIYGSDEAGRRAMASAMNVLREETAYMVLDRAAEGAALLDEFGVEPAVLRSRAASARLELDWKTIQRRFQERLPAALYLAAVLDDDLVAEAVDLWWWAPAPGPARPDVRKAPIENGRVQAGPLWRLLAALDPEPAGRAQYIGAVFIESLAGDALAVAAVEPGSPAEAAGLRPGMEVLSVSGREASALQLSAVLAELSSGGTLELEVLTGQGEAAVTLSPEWNWMPLDPYDPELLLAGAASRRLRELDEEGDVPHWLLELDLATLLLGTGEAAEAARRLEAIDVSGLEETHAELVRYTLGLALASVGEAGSEAFRARALAVFDELASTDRERRLAMRARLRADALRP